VNRWKNSIASAQNSPSRQKKKGTRLTDTEQGEQDLSASVTCEETEDGATCVEDEDGLLVQFKKHVEKDLLSEKSKISTMDPPTNPIGFNFGQVARFSPKCMNRNNSEKDVTGEFFRVKPYGIYPSEYNMNESELYRDMLRESESFVKVESRSNERQIGTLKVEVLSCMGLPKFDRFSKPNAIAYLVCGDTAFATDYIVSSLSPLWPARSRRAAEIPLFHAFAKLYLGVFNATDKDVDDYAGRVVINIASLRHGVQYDVNLPLKASTMVYDQRPRGVLRVRFSLYWSDERAAVLSYLPWNKSDLPWVNDPSRVQFMSIPCADSKTLRNVAYTVHGHDLPGKFSRRAFRATTREMGLYKVNIQFVLKSLLRDTMSYKQPFISCYVFMGWMSLVYFNRINLVPSFVVSFLIIVFYCNYLSFLKDKNDLEMRFKPLSMSDMVAMLWHGHTQQVSDQSPEVVCANLDTYRALVEQSRPDDKHHQEFPFSHPERYKRGILGEMLVPSQTQKNKGPKSLEAEKQAAPSSDCMDEGDRQDKDKYGKETDSGYESDDSCSEVPMKNKRPHGPEQSDEVDAKEGNLFKQNFEELEGKMHMATGNIFHKYVAREIREEFVKPEKSIPETSTKFTNPLAALTATFLEPVMKAIEVYLVSVRASFNVFTWRDPFLSFWTFSFLFVAMVFLALFPWRVFLCLVGLIGFGPQNIFLRFLFDAKETSQTDEAMTTSADQNKETEPKLAFGFGKRKNKPGYQRSDSSGANKELDKQGNDKCVNLFSVNSIGNPQGKKNQDEKLHEVIVPYQRFETERFYFWPPYPSPKPAGIVTAETVDLQKKKDA